MKSLQGIEKPGLALRQSPKIKVLDWAQIAQILTQHQANRDYTLRLLLFRISVIIVVVRTPVSHSFINSFQALS